ncbi:MAG: DNA repair protein RadA [Alphaproteobacteria bacterium]|nr:DNA repair protein RadA [Alphaproteobacteria bacterium]MBF0251393.1 DNA repair protein RadA [Alphaproteobacteria bacterium]
MAKAKTQFVCQECGAVFPKWAGKCESCGAWNTLVEEAPSDDTPKGLGGKKGRRINFVGLEGAEKRPPRRTTGIEEFDRVLGGGMVAGSAILVGGEPGIGKSTILLQAAANLAKGGRVAYISGEEAVDQLRLRASRLGLEKAPVELAAATNVRDIVTTLDDDPPDVAIIDSIQTMYVDNLESAPGTVAQVRTSAQELIRLSKRRGFPVLLVGHVTKEGQIAGPRVLEHMVDTVLYFEGDRSHQFRILRAVKNRFGATDEIGVFEMSDAGLAEVSNPSALFLSDRDRSVSGSAVFAGMEGTRPMLLEVQALVSPSTLGTPRRAVVGWDSARLSMIMAVIETRCGLAIGANDVYLNVAGGLRVTEPAADLAVAAALMSSLSGVPVADGCVFFGEIGLSGGVRAVSHAEGRLKEAAKLGFKRAVVPKNRGKAKIGAKGIKTDELDHLFEMVRMFESET